MIYLVIRRDQVHRFRFTDFALAVPAEPDRRLTFHAIPKLHMKYASLERIQLAVMRTVWTQASFLAIGGWGHFAEYPSTGEKVTHPAHRK